MQRITSATAADLFDIAATRRIEQAASAALPAHTLMRRAGLAVARLGTHLTRPKETRHVGSYLKHGCRLG